MGAHAHSVVSTSRLLSEGCVSRRDGRIGGVRQSGGVLEGLDDLRNELLTDSADGDGSISLGVDTPGRGVAKSRDGGIDVVRLLDVEISERRESSVVALLLGELDGSTRSVRTRE
jgi:hypothetical protein